MNFMVLVLLGFFKQEEIPSALFINDPILKGYSFGNLNKIIYSWYHKIQGQSKHERQKNIGLNLFFGVYAPKLATGVFRSCLSKKP